MSDSPASTINLDDLAEYKIDGELTGREDAKTYLGSRREDGTPVLIAISRTPADDDGNALSLLAADTNLLATLSHPHLLRVLDGKWVGTDAFAVITERVTSPTLAELIAREDLPFPRIAAILREVNGLLEWARQHRIVHRAVTADTLFVENGSDRVLAAFAISPIPFGRVSPVGVDAKTIGMLAKAMLSQHSDIATRVTEQTEALVALSHTSESVPDIPAYIASIAMADALKQGEIEYEKAKHAIEEAQRLAREKLEAERQQHERATAEQREQFEKERAQYQRDLEKEQRALAKEREALAQERNDHQRDREKLEHEREEHRRAAAAAAAAAATAAAAQRAAAQRVVHERPEEAVPVRPRVSPPPVAKPAAAKPAAAKSPPPAPLTAPAIAKTSVAKASVAKPAAGKPRYEDWRSWRNIGIVAGALVVAATVTTLAIGSHRKSGSNSPSEARDVAAAATPIARVVDSAGGSVMQSIVPLPSDVPDSVWNAAAEADSAAARLARRDRAARRAAAAEAAARREAEANAAASQPAQPRNDPNSPFSLGFMTPIVRSDSAARRDSLARSRLDSAPKRDTLPKRDSIAPRDTTAR